MNDVRVHTFWTGPQSPIIRLCLESIARNCPGSECWNLEKWRAVYDGRLGPWQAIARQRPNVQSDILRAWLLATQGGIWIDADYIAFRDLRPLWRHIENGADLVTYRVPASKVCTALMVARPESQIILAQCQQIADRLARRKHLSAMAIGPRSFIRAIRAYPAAGVTWVPFRLIHPRPWWTWGHHRRVLLSHQPYRFHPRAWGFMLTHAAIARLKVGSTREEILSDASPIGQAFRKAFSVES